MEVTLDMVPDRIFQLVTQLNKESVAKIAYIP